VFLQSRKRQCVWVTSLKHANNVAYRPLMRTAREARRGRRRRLRHAQRQVTTCRRRGRFPLSRRLKRPSVALVAASSDLLPSHLEDLAKKSMARFGHDSADPSRSGLDLVVKTRWPRTGDDGHTAAVSGLGRGAGQISADRKIPSSRESGRRGQDTPSPTSVG
jgi:hypothetical protein